jgi:hypothetical protein
LRRTTKDDKQRFMHKRLVKNMQVGEPGFDDAHLILCTEPESARLLFQNQEVRAAAAALELDVDRNAGGIDHIELGRDLSALIGVSGVSEAELAPRIAALLEPLANLARIVACQRLPAPSKLVPGWATNRMLYLEGMVAIFTFVLPFFGMVGSLPVLYSGMHVLFVWSGLLYGLVAGAVVGPLCLLVAKPWFRWPWFRWPAAIGFAALVVITTPGVLAIANAVSGSVPEVKAMTVAESKESRLIGLLCRSVELEDGMTVAVDWKLGESLRTGDAVEVTRVRGALGQARVLKLSKPKD